MDLAVLDGSTVQPKDPLLSIAGGVRGLEKLTVFIFYENFSFLGSYENPLLMRIF